MELLMTDERIRTAFILEDFVEAQEWLVGTLKIAFPSISIQVVDSIKLAKQSLTSIADINLIDLKLPDGSGLEILRDIKQRRRSARCVVTTIYDDDKNLFPALAAGADGYLLKDQDQHLLAEELRRILHQQPPLSPMIAKKIMGSFVRGKDISLDEPLTPRQLEVLRMIVYGDSIQNVANKLGISYHTAASHVRGIYEKLGVSNRAEVAAKAFSIGLS
jgi:DNA-binding NarL/FixJ family response regulator